MKRANCIGSLSTAPLKTKTAKCVLCGNPTNKKYCNRCIEVRLGVMSGHEQFAPKHFQGLGNGGFRTRNFIAGEWI